MQRGILALGLLATAIGAVRGAAPPARGLTPPQAAWLQKAEEQIDAHTYAGRFAEAARLAREKAALFARALGARHWHARSAGFEVEKWQALAKLPAQTRREVGRSFQKNALAMQRNAQGKHREAEGLFREALDIRRKALGEDHAETSTGYNNLAGCLYSMRKPAEAVPLFRKALAIRQKVGENHPATAQSYGNLGSCLRALGKHSEALALLRKSLAVRQKTLGEVHPETAVSYNKVASCLEDLGKLADALPLYRKALEVRIKALGEDHPDTAESYNNLAHGLRESGNPAEALPLLKKALAVYEKALGEGHPNTAVVYDNVALCLSSQGKHAAALPLFRKVVAVRVKALGDDHPRTAAGYNNLGMCLHAQGKSAEALPLVKKALDVRREELGGEDHETAESYNNVALCLQAAGKHAEALPLFRKALAVNEKALGPDHPLTAAALNNLAFCLQNLGKASEALPLYKKALVVSEKALGKAHPQTAGCLTNIASCLEADGKYAEALALHRRALDVRTRTQGRSHPDAAECHNHAAHCLLRLGKPREAARHYEAALLGHEFGKLSASERGFGRSLYRAEHLSPRAALAVCLVRLNEPVKAWQHAESNLARGLLDDLSGSADAAEETADRSLLERLNDELLPLVTSAELTDAERRRRETLTRRRDGLLAEMAKRATKRAEARVLSLEEVRKRLPADAALVFWLDELDQHLACVLRERGDPVWVDLPGSGKGDAWGKDDRTLPERTLAALRDPSGDEAARKRLTAALRRQRLDPLGPHLKGVKRLLVVPSGAMARVPVEALTDRYQVGYVPSASVFALLRQKGALSLQGAALLAVADPAFDAAPPPEPPASGIMLKSVLPGSNAAKAGLRPGDVVLSIGSVKVGSQVDLESALADLPAALAYWRDGQRLEARLPAAPLGATVDPRSARAAVRAWRRDNEPPGGRGTRHAALPGTRREAEAIARLVKDSTLLAGSDASEQRLRELARSGKLKSFRILHIATHGEVNETRPLETSLILAQDRLPRATPGEKPIDGRLTVGSILKDWELRAGLVVLSACETGLGKSAQGEGLLGFTQALLHKGARSVVLSRWKVDDSATALLMVRFYENLLGKRDGLEKPLGRAAALDEAKRWLRELTRKEAERLATLHRGGALRGSEGDEKPPEKARPAQLKGERPYSHPFYWAAFTLVGDPD